MKTLGSIFGALLALALTAAIGYYGYIAAKRFVVLFARLDFTVAMVTATATVALLLAAMMIAGSIRRAGARNIEVQLRADKAEAYKVFVDLWEQALRPGQTAEAIAQLSRQMQDANHLLLLHGCAAVVQAHAAIQALDLQQARVKFADTLLAIRRDLGLESRGLDAKELVQLLLTPPEKTPGASRPSVHQDSQPRVSLAPN